MRFSDCTFQAFGPKMFLLFHKSLIWNKPSALIFGGRSDSDFSWPRSQPHVCAVRVGSCRIVQRIRVKNVRGVEIKEPTCVPLPPTQRYYHKKNTKVLLLTCGRMICEAAFSRTGTSTNTNSKHSPSTTQTLTCLPWQGGQKLMTIIYPISDKVVNCNHLNGQPQQYLSICLSSSENYISTKFHYTACIMLLLVTTCEGSWRHGCLSKVPKYDSPDWWLG